MKILTYILTFSVAWFAMPEAKAMDINNAIAASASGLRAQSTRLKMHAENIANADSILTENGEAYRKKQAIVVTKYNRRTGVNEVSVERIVEDRRTPFNRTFDPNHPLADENGLLTFSNVNTLAESADMRAASRLYEANLQAIEVSKEMLSRTVQMLR